MDTIQPNARAVLEYTLRDDNGNILDTSEAEDGQPIVYVHGYGMLVPGLEAALVGLGEGAEKLVRVPSAEAFGDHDEQLVFEVDRRDVSSSKKVEEGDELLVESPDGTEIVVRVIRVKDKSVIVDANHPLAGKTLHYNVEVVEVRAATDEEIAEAAEAFEAAGYDRCSDPTHDHDDHDCAGANLVQLGSKKIH